MTRPAQNLEPVIEIAERRRDEALAECARLQTEQRQAQEQMDQLVTYADEANRRWAERGAAGVDVTLLMHHRQFMAKLDNAMAFQQDVLADRAQRVQRATAAMQEAERDLASLRKYAARQIEAWQQTLQRREQKHTDEMAQNIHRRRLENDSNFQPMS
ncbi:flagellar export protein FliJ [Hydrogenophaga intermedia]|uniref:flagellar export protein FliJ n=1 Tax=Hydrogenophaga intermedia TaxID=65786 RepID=UPI002043CE44|nr:flagellar export protein FliJ [Hydrogenophaga intermedia]MCM3564841.1 flagellar export protein FliJ [Hydrogenophaga intermedia]